MLSHPYSLPVEQERPIVIKPSTPEIDVALEPERGRSLSRRSSRHSSDSSSGIILVAGSPTNERRAPSPPRSPPSYESRSLQREEPAVASRSPSRSRSRAPSIETPPLVSVLMPPPPHGFLEFEDLCVYPSQRSGKSRSRSRTPPVRVMTQSPPLRRRRSSSSRSQSRSRSRSITWTTTPRPIIITPRSRSNSRSRPSLRRSPTRIIFERSSSRRARSRSPSWSRSGLSTGRTQQEAASVVDHVVVTAEPRPRSRNRSRSPRRTLPPSLPPVITPRCPSPSPPRQRGGSRRRSRSRSPPVVVVVQQPPYQPIRSPLQEFYPTISPLPSPRVVPAHLGSHTPTIVPAPVADQTGEYMTGRIDPDRSSSPYGPPLWMGPEYAVRRRSPSASSKPDHGPEYYPEIVREPRHPRFCFEDGNLSFSVEGTQYNVHRYLFQDFDASFYQSHSKDALNRFLSVLYPDDYLSHECKSTSEWTSVLEIAHPRHPKVARLAIHQLSSSGDLSAVEKLRLAQKCDIDAWLAPAFHQLVLRTLRGEPLDVEEGRKQVNAVMRDLGAYLDEGKVGVLVERQVVEMQVRK
ncbi:hypothetical protein HMN09_01315000 [Mycena chlorophos]|uniref:BTB domain-containing protein n=1 Tax=Mycena chlorophos TaxID=658473 RepID=A0A8H6S016_MYCCL|nr:hypothetical protein HMN09_01315000 [Mycena chlorophos]